MTLADIAEKVDETLGGTGRTGVWSVANERGQGWNIF